MSGKIFQQRKFSELRYIFYNQIYFFCTKTFQVILSFANSIVMVNMCSIVVWDFKSDHQQRREILHLKITHQLCLELNNQHCNYIGQCTPANWSMVNDLVVVIWGLDEGLQAESQPLSD